VLVYSSEGTLLARWGAGGGNGAAGGQTGAFRHPSGIAVRNIAPGEENIYVADEGNDRVVELNANGETLRQWGSAGTGEGRFHAPASVAIDGAGDIYVLDSENNRVEQFEGDGHFLTKWGVRGLLLGEFSQPSAIAVDCAGNVYVADTNNNRVERFIMESPAPTSCVAAGTWPPPLDVAPVLKIALPRASGVLARRALALKLSCERGCKVLLTGTLSASSGRRRAVVPLVAVARSLPVRESGYARLRVGPKSLRRLQRVLGKGNAMTARVRIVAAGPTGRRTIVNRIYSVRR
jgi:DNA-binding beta-propeller fold protein YncE